MRRTKAQEWKPDEPPLDTAPPAVPRPNLATWGVTQAEAQAMLARQVCPVCGEGPWKSPLNHVSRKHGIDRFTMRDVCGLTLGETVTDPDLHATFVERGRSTDMTQVNHAGKPRRKQRWTTAGAQRNVETLTEWEAKNPDAARQARSKAGQAGAASRWGT